MTNQQLFTFGPSRVEYRLKPDGDGEERLTRFSGRTSACVTSRPLSSIRLYWGAREASVVISNSLPNINWTILHISKEMIFVLGQQQISLINLMLLVEIFKTC